MPEQRRRLDSKVLPHGVEIGEVGFERDVLRLHMICAFAASALVVVEEPERVRPSIHVGKQIACSKSGPPWSTTIGCPCPISRT